MVVPLSDRDGDCETSRQSLELRADVPEFTWNPVDLEGVWCRRADHLLCPVGAACTICKHVFGCSWGPNFWDSAQTFAAMVLNCCTPSVSGFSRKVFSQSVYFWAVAGTGHGFFLQNIRKTCQCAPFQLCQYRVHCKRDVWHDIWAVHLMDIE